MRAFLGAVSLLGLTACAEGSFVWVTDLPLPVEVPAVVGPRDTILVLVRNQAPLSGEFVVHDDGTYLQPTLGTLSVAGREPAWIAADLRARLKGILTEPEVGVSIAKAAPVRVNVVGEVKAPGSYELTRDRSLIAALAVAGWLTDFAHRDRVFVLRPAPPAAPGQRPGRDERVRFNAAELTAAEPHAAGFRLRDGDVVVVE